MANLVEDTEWTPGIYQLEEDDEVKGGPDGIDNLQAKQLANRTLYLKALIEELGGTTAFVQASIEDKQPLDPTLTALAALITAADKLIYSTGADAFATSTLTAFARSLLDDVDAAAARETLELTDVVTASNSVTHPQFNSTTKVATTAFVQRALGNFQGLLGVSSPTTLTAADAGKRVTATNAPITLPDTSSVPPGAAFSIFAWGANGVTVNRVGADVIAPGGGVPSLTTFFISSGSECTFTAENGIWEVTGTGALKYSHDFASNLGSYGYKRFPDVNSPTGFSFLMWGKNIGSALSDFTVSFPIAFPHECLAVVTSCDYTAGSAEIGYVAAGAPTTTGFIGRSSGALSTRWFAFGY